MDKKIIYISGPMTGFPDFNKPAFHAKEKELRDAGHEVISPARTNIHTASWIDYICVDLRLLEKCTHICFLNGWKDSPGAQIEAIASKRLGLKVYEDENVEYTIKVIDGKLQLPQNDKPKGPKNITFKEGY